MLATITNKVTFTGQPRSICVGGTGLAVWRTLAAFRYHGFVAQIPITRDRFDFMRHIPNASIPDHAGALPDLVYNVFAPLLAVICFCLVLSAKQDAWFFAMTLDTVCSWILPGGDNNSVLRIDQHQSGNKTRLPAHFAANATNVSFTKLPLSPSSTDFFGTALLSIWNATIQRNNTSLFLVMHAVVPCDRRITSTHAYCCC